MNEKPWFETYWWSPPLQQQCGSPWDQWSLGKPFKTLEAAEKACKEAQKKQPYLHYQIRKVEVVKNMKGATQ